MLMFSANLDVFREHMLLIGVGDCTIGRTIGQFRNTWAQISKIWGTFNTFLARSCVQGNACHEDTASALFKQLVLVCCCNADFVKNLKPITESIPTFKFSILNNRAECELVLPSGNLIFLVFRDRNFVGYPPVWRTLDDDSKNLTQADFLTKCFRTLFSQVTPVTARVYFSDRGSLIFHCSWMLAIAKGSRRGWFFFFDLYAARHWRTLDN